MIQKINNTSPEILVVGSHARIIQSMLDFDYMTGKSKPSITALVGGGRTVHKCFFGPEEILLASYASIEDAVKAGIKCNFLVNLSSANSVKKNTETFFELYPEALGAHIFAEGVRELDAVSINQNFTDKLIAGPSGVGLFVSGVMKLGAIGGIYGGNLNVISKQRGNVAIICSSGGMVNELINHVVRFGGSPSFAVSYGGDKFPITTPLEWCLEAQSDPLTDLIIYFGELGGFDEYEIAEAFKDGRLNKPIHAYIAGHFVNKDEAIQFGHAKALAKTPDEHALAKMTILSAVGINVYKTYGDFSLALEELPYKISELENRSEWNAPETERRSSLFTAVKDRGDNNDPFIKHTLCTLLETNSVSKVLCDFTEKAFSNLIDHGAEPSGAVNAMVTARAGRDMSSAVAAAILTVGDRFGGAINNAANNWFFSVENNVLVETMLETFKQNSAYVPGIGHKKYTIYKNDPRVEELRVFANEFIKDSRYFLYAESVAKRTSEKKANLILNVDGAIAAILLDLLVEHENYSIEKIKDLLETEFFNSYFIIPRTVGFVGNYLSQKRRDEGLFRLPEDEVFYL